MGDQENAGAAQSSENLLADPVWTFDPKANTEGSDAKEDGEAPQGTDGEDTPQDPPKDPDPKGEEPKDEEKKEEKKEEKAPDTKPKEIQVRQKSKTDFILERKQKQLEKAKQDKLDRINKELEAEGIEPDEDEIDLDPSDEETVSKVIQKKFGPQFEAIERQRFDNEVAQFLSTSDVAKHATPAELARFKEYALHPSRAEVPYDELIISALGASRLMEIGAQMEREAAKKATASKVGGSVWSKSGDTKTDIASMTDKEFEDYQMNVRIGKV